MKLHGLNLHKTTTYQPQAAVATKTPAHQPLDRYQPSPQESWKPYKPVAAKSSQETRALAQWKERVKKDENYAKLTEDQRAQVDRLASKTAGAQESLVRLVDSQKLAVKDKEGKTVLDHLEKIEQSKLPEGFDKSKVIAQLADQVADPKKINQGLYGTCAQASVQYIHAKTDPADYARVNSELLTQGKARLASGDSLTLNPTAIADDKSNRGEVSRVYQSSITDYANGDEVGYDNKTEFHGKPGAPIGVHVEEKLADGTSRKINIYKDELRCSENGRRLIINGREEIIEAESVREVQHGGLRDDQVMRALEGITGRKMEYQGIDKNTPEPEKAARQKSALDGMKQKLSEGKTVYVATTWDVAGSRDSRHALAVEKIENGRVYLRNPWGVDEAQGGAPRKKEGDGGLISMTEEEFRSRIEASIS